MRLSRNGTPLRDWEGDRQREVLWLAFPFRSKREEIEQAYYGTYGREPQVVRFLEYEQIWLAGPVEVVVVEGEQ